jgi:hypothetical protein
MYDNGFKNFNTLHVIEIFKTSKPKWNIFF